MISRMSLSVSILRNPTPNASCEKLSLAFRSLLPGLERLKKLSMASSCRIASPRSAHFTRQYRVSRPMIWWIIYMEVQRLSPALLKWLLKTSSGSSCPDPERCRFCGLRHPCHSLRSLSARQSYLREESISRPATTPLAPTSMGKSSVRYLFASRSIDRSAYLSALSVVLY